MHLTRRQWLASTTALGIAAETAEPIFACEPSHSPFAFCLNTSTLGFGKLSILQKLDIAADAGFTEIEPWIRELDEHVKSGGNLKEVEKRLRAHGLKVANAIGFSPWIVDDDSQRKKGLEQAKREMDVVRQIGGSRIAAPPAGATDRALDLTKAVERYRTLLELGTQMGVVPQLEIWGFSKTLRRLSDAMFVALETGHPQACVLPDIYHLYKGGSDFNGLKLLGPDSMRVIHVNDYPATPPQSTITDAHRIYPGDGVAPWKQIVRDLRAIGFKGSLSLELFNRTYWMQDPVAVARTGLEKMRRVVESA